MLGGDYPFLSWGNPLTSAGRDGSLESRHERGVVRSVEGKGLASTFPEGESRDGRGRVGGGGMEGVAGSGKGFDGVAVEEIGANEQLGALKFGGANKAQGPAFGLWIEAPPLLAHTFAHVGAGARALEGKEAVGKGEGGLADDHFTAPEGDGCVVAEGDSARSWRKQRRRPPMCL